jgi:hypothetical protein
MPGHIQSSSSQDHRAISIITIGDQKCATVMAGRFTAQVRPAALGRYGDFQSGAQLTKNLAISHLPGQSVLADMTTGVSAPRTSSAKPIGGTRSAPAKQKRLRAKLKQVKDQLRWRRYQPLPE